MHKTSGINTYTMSQVEALTGIKSHTLRVWERRYTIITAQRTATNIRFYTDTDLKKLLNISILMTKGYRISKIDKMSDEEVNTLVLDTTSESTVTYQEDINRLVLSMVEMNEALFNSVFEKHFKEKGLLDTVLYVIYPFLHHVGVLWIANNAIPAQEHFISNLIRQKIIASIDRLDIDTSKASKILMFLPENESHELALLLAHFIAKDLGFQVYYLGQNVPLLNIEDVLEVVDIDILMTIFVTPMSTEDYKRFNAVFEGIDKRVLISGNYDVENLLGNFEYIDSPQELVTAFKSYLD